MRQRTMNDKDPAEKTVRDIRRKTRKHRSSEEKIRIVISGLRGEESIAALCRREGIAESLYYSWSKEFLEAGKKRLAGDTARQATSEEVKALRAEARGLKEALAEQMMETRHHARRFDSLTGTVGAQPPGWPDARYFNSVGSAPGRA